MLEIKSHDDKRKYKIVDVTNNVETLIVELDLINHAITNKFQIVIDLVDKMCKEIEGFESWFKTLLLNYISSKNSEFVYESCNDFLKFSEIYVDKQEINFDKFVNLSKVSTTSIVFYPEDIRALAISSTALKLYSIFFCDNELKLPDNMHKKVYDVLIKPCVEKKVTVKIFQLVRSRTYRSSITDRYIWGFIKSVLFEDPDSYVMTIFNFLLEKILALIDITQNPIPFIIGTSDDSIKWLTRSLFKDRTIYGEIFGGSEDLYGSSLSKESFYIFCCNDTIAKVAKAGMELLEGEYNMESDSFTNVQERIEKVNHLCPAVLYITFPIACRVLEVPYKFLLTIPPKHSVLVGLFLHSISEEILSSRFPALSEFLISCPKENLIYTKSQYKMRHPGLVINDDSPIFGFSSPYFKYKLLSAIIGILNASKKNLVDTITGDRLKRVRNFCLEDEVTRFYNELYSGQLDETFKTIREIADKHL